MCGDVAGLAGMDGRPAGSTACMASRRMALSFETKLLSTMWFKMLRNRFHSDQWQRRRQQHEANDEQRIEFKRNRRHEKNAKNSKIHIILAILIFLHFGICLWQWRRPFSNHDDVKASKVEPDSCGCFPHDGTGARIAYLITLHNKQTLDDGFKLFKSIAAPGNIILIHIDRKLESQDYERSDFYKLTMSDNDCMTCGAEVLVDSKFDLEWGKWSMNDPTHWSKFMCYYLDLSQH